MEKRLAFIIGQKGARKTAAAFKQVSESIFSTEKRALASDRANAKARQAWGASNAELKRTGKALGKTNHAINNQTKELQHLSRENKDAAQALRSSGIAAKLSGGKFQGLQSRLHESSRQAGQIQGYRNLKRELKALKTEAKAGGISATHAKKAWRAKADELRKTSTALKRAGIDTKRLSTHEKRLASDIKKTNQAMAAQIAKAGKLAAAQAKAAKGRQIRQSAASDITGLAVAAAPIIGAGKVAIDMESAMADVRKVVDFKGYEGGIAAFQKELVKLSANKIPLKATELAAIAAAGGQLGVAAKNLRPFVTTTSKMSVAFDMAASEAGEASAKLSNVYGIPIGQIELLGDAVNHLSDNTAAKSREIVAAMLRIGSTSKQFGLSAANSAALADAFIALGKPPEVAGTAINSMLTKLMTADKGSAAFKRALSAIGMDAYELKDAIKNDAQGALMEFLEALEGADPDQKMGILVDLFGREFADDIATLVGSMDQYKKAVGLVADKTKYAGSMHREFGNRASTTANKLIMLTNKFTAEVLGFGGGLKPTLDSAIDGIGGILDKIAALRAEFPLLTGAVQKTVAALIGGVVAFKALKMAGKFFGGGLKEMWHGGKALGYRFGLGGKKGRTGRAGRKGRGDLVGALTGGVSGAAPVFVTNWPGGMGDGLAADLPGEGGKKKGKTRGKKRSLRSRARTRFRAGRRSLGRRLGGLASAARGAGAWATGAAGSLAINAATSGSGAKVAANTAIKAASSAGKIASKAVGKSVAKVAAKTGAKALGKSALKKIPGVGLIAGAAFGLERALSGDFLGGLMEVGSGLVSLIPGIGTAASLAIDAGLAAKDITSAPTSAEEALEEPVANKKPVAAQIKAKPEAKKEAAKAEQPKPKATEKPTPAHPIPGLTLLTGSIAGLQHVLGIDLVNAISALKEKITLRTNQEAKPKLATTQAQAKPKPMAVNISTGPKKEAKKTSSPIPSVPGLALITGSLLGLKNVLGIDLVNTVMGLREYKATALERRAPVAAIQAKPKLMPVNLSTGPKKETKKTSSPMPSVPGLALITGSLLGLKNVLGIDLVNAVMGLRENKATALKQQAPVAATQAKPKPMAVNLSPGPKKEAKKTSRPMPSIPGLALITGSLLGLKNVLGIDLVNAVMGLREYKATVLSQQIPVGTTQAKAKPLPIAAKPATQIEPNKHLSFIGNIPGLAQLNTTLAKLSHLIKPEPPIQGQGNIITEAISQPTPISQMIDRLHSPGPIEIALDYHPTIHAPGEDTKSINRALVNDRVELTRLVERTIESVFSRQTRLGVGNA
ncbi:phage tail tape measure protein [Dethiosulfatarculus sandiegensis]|uniref:Phage tail tape measure protein domain-containing protein n=1 Tax=Dethiosulfatarculus sandiegensis TaxID=1429043 RepID=A0A0D2JA75_9BACT|nr:phage tail tape measure protein [Dethiosulfatarculus sandiegensis]KIX15034.1 hypothetical protein X474_05735 [Dethiosulfatarculus sandiegensis]